MGSERDLIPVKLNVIDVLNESKKLYKPRAGRLTLSIYLLFASSISLLSISIRLSLIYIRIFVDTISVTVNPGSPGANPNPIFNVPPNQSGLVTRCIGYSKNVDAFSKASVEVSGLESPAKGKSPSPMIMAPPINSYLLIFIN